MRQQLDLVGSNVGGLSIYRDTVTIPRAAVIADPAWRAAEASGDPTAVVALREPRAVPLEESGGRLHGGPFAPDEFPPGASVLLPQQFDRHWSLTPAGGGSAIRARPAFGWAVGFAYRPAADGFTVRFTGQALRTLQVVLLSILWLAALWITRRRSAETR